jgi:hypothetical protein
MLLNLVPYYHHSRRINLLVSLKGDGPIEIGEEGMFPLLVGTLLTDAVSPVGQGPAS